MTLKACVVCGTPTRTTRCPKHTLRTRQRGNAYQPVRQAIAARDHWTCTICAKPIDPQLKRPHPQALHIDHIVPFAHGGTDDPANLRATHAACNLKRGDRG